MSSAGHERNSGIGPSSATGLRGSKRATNACIRCRERKIKCSGLFPCDGCSKRGKECNFDPEDKKVVVSERFLSTLKRKSALFDRNASPNSKRIRSRPSRGEAENNEHQAHPRQSSVELEDADGNSVIEPDVIANAPVSRADTQTGDDDDDSLAVYNPLATGSSTFLTDYHGRRRFLGPSSTWAYSRQAMTVIQSHLRYHESPEVPLHGDGHAFSLQWPSMTAVDSLQMDKLPSIDYALYLTNTVKFHLGQMYHLFDEPQFLQGLHQFYEQNPQAEPPLGKRLWYIQYLLIMSLGKALLVPTAGGEKPTGSDFVSRAIAILPDTFGLYQDPVHSAEILCCLALYLQSVDHRNSAYSYIGTALRIALSQGLHRELIGTLSSAEVHRHRCVWWTIYILDRKFSSLMGAPTSIHDADITVPLPEPEMNSRAVKALRTHVALSRLQATILSTVYSVDGKLDISFLRSIRHVLRSMASIASEINGSFEFKFNSSEPTSRVSATLNLYYHQCIVLATRPLLLCLLRDVLAHKRDSNHSSQPRIVERVKAILWASHESATKSLRILSALQSQQLPETFLPFDLESTFSSAFVLSLMSTIHPFPEGNWSYLDVTFSLLDSMIGRGSVVAGYRKDELERLSEILRLAELESIHDQAGRDAVGTGVGEASTTTAIPVASDAPLQPPAGQRQWYRDGVGTANGLSPDQMLSIAGLLDWEPNIGELADVQFGDSWMWTEEDPALQLEAGGNPPWNV